MKPRVKLLFLLSLIITGCAKGPEPYLKATNVMPAKTAPDFVKSDAYNIPGE